MKELIVLCGAPGSGKSTWAKEHATEKDLYVSRDEIRFSLLEPNDKYFDKEKQVFKQYINTINKGLLDNITEKIYADATHIDSISRAKLLNQIELFNGIKTAIFFNVPFIECCRRNTQREGLRCVPEKNLQDIYNKIEKPTKEEGFDNVYIIDN